MLDVCPEHSVSLATEPRPPAARECDHGGGCPSPHQDGKHLEAFPPQPGTLSLLATRAVSDCKETRRQK